MSKKSILPVVLTALVAGGLHSTSASAQATAVSLGPQLCQPMSINVALKGLQWRSDGLYNTSIGAQWVVCSLPTGLNTSTAGAANRLTNFADFAQEITCIYKMTDELGATVRNVVKNRNVPAGISWGVNVDSMRKGTLDNFTVSCKLPPQTALGGIFVESY